MDRKLQWHRADSLRQHGFLVVFIVFYGDPASGLLYTIKKICVCILTEQQLLLVFFLCVIFLLIFNNFHGTETLPCKLLWNYSLAHKAPSCDGIAAFISVVAPARSGDGISSADACIVKYTNAIQLLFYSWTAIGPYCGLDIVGKSLFHTT